MRLRYIWFAAGWFFIVFTAGCAAPHSSTLLQETPVTSAQSPPSLSPTFSPTSTPTPSPTSDPTHTLSSTPRPTLTANKEYDYVKEMLATNGGCEPPCWWGIKPGETTWMEVQTQLGPLGRWSGPWSDNEVRRYDFVFDMPEEIDPLGFFEPSIGVKNGVVTGISLCGSWIKQDFDDSLAGLLQTFGLPDEIWLKVVTETQGEPYYEISLFYPSNGVLLGASGIVNTQDNRLMICPQEFKLDAFPPGVLLWSPEEQFTYASIFPAVLGQDNTDMSDYHLLEEWSSDFDRDDFYTTYLNPQTATCFEVVLFESTE